jgi:Leucine-rich repeat (LRR) protein
VMSDEVWLDHLIAWADKNKLSKNHFPRNKQAILALTSLFLRSNKFTELPEFIDKLTVLTELDLSGNPLTELPEFIRNLPKLTRLEL